MLITYFQNHVATITYDEQHEMGLTETRGFLSSDEFREVVTMAMRLIEERQPLRWLADNSKMKAIRQADQDWFSEVVFPTLRDSSIRRNATVVSEDIFNKMAVEQLLKRAGDLGDMLLQEFEDKKQALEWVLQPVE